MQADHPLKAYRFKHELSQAALADQLGVSRHTVIRWETGDRKVDRSKLAYVSQITGIPAKDLRPDLAELFGVG